MEIIDWKKTISAEWKSRRETEKLTGPSPPLFPLAANPFGEEEVLAMTEVLLSGRLTMGENVEFAEKEFAAAVGAPYAVMVNSGSSANLIMINALLVSAGALHDAYRAMRSLCLLFAGRRVWHHCYSWGLYLFLSTLTQ
jgi:CDP-4-dehydro-6-deoxyglucose reductase, E1